MGASTLAFVSAVLICQRDAVGRQLGVVDLDLDFGLEAT
jgi:hypothetical protein